MLLLIFWLLSSTNDKVKMAHLARFLVLSPAYAKEQLPWLQKFPEVLSLTESKEKLYALPQRKPLEKNLLVFW